jgi:hypothetical protein
LFAHDVLNRRTLRICHKKNSRQNSKANYVMQEKAFQCTFQCTLEYQIQVGKSNKSTLLKFQVYHGCKIDYYHIGCLQQQQRRRHQQRAYQMESA